MFKPVIKFADFIEPDQKRKGFTKLKFRTTLDYNYDLTVSFEVFFKSSLNGYTKFKPFETHIQEINQWSNEI